MTQELYWLTLTAVMTALFWMPYILNRMKEMGPMPAVMNPNADPTPEAAWARRMMNAHRNAVENLAVFAPLALAVVVAGVGNESTALACAIFFYARLAHFVVYTMGIPLLRTVAFLVGFGCQIALAMALLQF